MKTDLAKRAVVLNAYHFCGVIASAFLFLGALLAVEAVGQTIKPWMFISTYFIALLVFIYPAGLVFLRRNATGLSKDEAIYCLCGGFDFRINRLVNEAIYGWAIDRWLLKGEKKTEPNQSSQPTRASGPRG